MKKKVPNPIRLTRRGREYLTICFTQSGIIKILHQNPKLLYEKKFHELVVGWIFAQFLEPNLRKTAQIWFPPKIGWEDHLIGTEITIDWILDNQDRLFDDSEVDICVGTPELFVKIQVARFFCPLGKNPQRRIAELIINKCQKYRPDPKLHLIVSIERKPNINEKELINLLTKIKIPFCGIILINKASPKRGHFSYCMLYPKPTIGKELMIPIPV
ncbi:MAG: hypothetical protein ACYS32_09180 [Planctomycetota bacterium]